jgi:hypothetical protein
MAISFPNQSRSYDATRRAIRFWGYDSAMEASFFVSEEALGKIHPGMRIEEAGLLQAFDRNREIIYIVAKKVYERGHKAPTTW